MALNDFLKSLLRQPQIVQNVTKIIEIGSPGTEINAGYIDEEYLDEIRGKDWADKADMMRRSDANVKMCLRAMKLPLSSSEWKFIPLEQTKEAKFQADFLSKCFFDDSKKNISKVLWEILSMLDFGYSIMEKTYQVKIADEVYGDYITLKSLGWRSQRTIERWIVDKGDGSLLAIEQIADGDLGRYVYMDSKDVIHFALEQEGANYEGISMLRPMYGAWKRKNRYLQLIAVGSEKYAIPTPVLSVPPGKENTKEYIAAEKALKCYTSNQKNYIIKPAGWDLAIEKVDYDAEKLKSMIEFENQEMVNSILAQFLMLGQGGASGNRALGDTLGDFFSQSLKYVADEITERLTQDLFKYLLKVNLGTDKMLCKLVCERLEERASEQWGALVNNFVNSGVVASDDVLEKTIREKMGLPPRDDKSMRIKTTKPEFKKEDEEKELSEKKKTDSVQKLIGETAEDLSKEFQRYVTIISTDYIKAIMKAYDKATDKKVYNVTFDTDPKNYPDYINALIAKDIYYTIKAKEQVLSKSQMTLSEYRMGEARQKKIENNISKLNEMENEIDSLNVKYVSNPFDRETTLELQRLRADYGRLSTDTKNLMLVEYDLSSEEINRITSRVKTLTQSQINDIKKAIDLQYQSSVGSTDSESILRKDLEDAREKLVNGPIVNTGSEILAAQTVNEARMDAAQDLEDEVESYTFVAEVDDATTDLCLELNGHTFSANDPDLDRYQPPLHHNCRSYLAFNLRGSKNNPSVNDGPPSISEKAWKQITLSEPENLKFKAIKTD
jgi:phage gp29-like protein